MNAAATWFEPSGLLRPFSTTERALLDWLLAKPGLPEADVAQQQLQASVVHELQAFRYLELFMSASAPLLQTFETGLYVQAYAPLSEVEGIGVLLHVVQGRVESLEFSYSPTVVLDELPPLSHWDYL